MRHDVRKAGRQQSRWINAYAKAHGKVVAAKQREKDAKAPLEEWFVHHPAAKTLQNGTGQVTYVEYEQNGFDTERFKEDHPKLWAAYQKEPRSIKKLVLTIQRK